jgi:hypothetical protein
MSKYAKITECAEIVAVGAPGTNGLLDQVQTANR